jgi:hypothetical protein
MHITKDRLLDKLTIDDDQPRISLNHPGYSGDSFV